jgi:hypothetical protein
MRYYFQRKRIPVTFASPPVAARNGTSKTATGSTTLITASASSMPRAGSSPDSSRLVSAAASQMTRFGYIKQRRGIWTALLTLSGGTWTDCITRMVSVSTYQSH